MNNQTPAFSIGKPMPTQMLELRTLWKEAFGDNDDFLDMYEKTAFSPDRCQCVTQNDHVVAALYWFDCMFMDKPVAYIYAVATAKKVRGQGICHALMKHTHTHLKMFGYIGAILVPGSPKLFHFYEKMGYKTCTYMDEISFDEHPLYALEKKTISLHNISADEYAKLRRVNLSKDAILQENENLDFLQTQSDFYAGDNFLMAAHKNGATLNAFEFLGDTSDIPSILHSLECTSGTFRTPGKETPFGMYISFTQDSSLPNYFGFAFD